MDAAVAHYYRMFRKHGDEPLYRSALSAWNSARSHIHFRERLAKDVAEHKKRSRAAKKAWRARKAKARAA